MNTVDVVAWLKEWLIHHPLRSPSEGVQASYTAEVMARIKTSEAPAPAWRWRPRPRVAFALGTAAVCGLTALMVVHRAPTQLAQQVEQSWQLLSELGEWDALPIGDLDEEVRTVDHLMMLAESQPASDDEAWIEQTIELLNTLDEPSAVPAEPQSLEELLQELESLDESELAT